MLVMLTKIIRISPAPLKVGTQEHRAAVLTWFCMKPGLFTNENTQINSNQSAASIAWGS